VTQGGPATRLEPWLYVYDQAFSELEIVMPGTMVLALFTDRDWCQLVRFCSG